MPPLLTACLSSAGMPTPLIDCDMEETAFDYYVVIGPRSRACQHARAWGVFELTAEYYTVHTVILYDVSVPGTVIPGGARFRGCRWRDSTPGRAPERCRRLALLRVRCERRRSVLPAYFTYASWKIKVLKDEKRNVQRGRSQHETCLFLMLSLFSRDATDRAELHYNGATFQSHAPLLSALSMSFQKLERTNDPIKRVFTGNKFRVRVRRDVVVTMAYKTGGGR